MALERILNISEGKHTHIYLSMKLNDTKISIYIKK
jgi:hypothetical protein